MLAPGRRARAAEEARAVVQSRLRELPVIHILVFGMMLILRPAVLGSLSVPIVAPFAALAAALAGMSLLLATRRFSLRSLRWLDLAMSLALAAVLVAYESQAIAGPLLQVDRIKAEKIMKNVILLLSFLMLIDAIYVPRGGGRPRSSRASWRWCRWGRWQARRWPGPSRSSGSASSGPTG